MEMKRILVIMAALAAAVAALLMGSGRAQESGLMAPFRIQTLFSVECNNYFDWQTVGLMHSYRKSRQPGQITRLLACPDEEKKNYRGMDLAPTLEVPSLSNDDWYWRTNKPAGIVHWLKHTKDAENVDWVVILDADMIIRAPIVPWELGAEKGKPVVAYYGEHIERRAALLAIHIDDLQALAPVWLSKSEELRQDRSHIYGYSLAAIEVGLRHKIKDNLMAYHCYAPQEGVEPILIHYGLPLSVGNWSFSKLEHQEDDVVYDCLRLFPEPPYPKEVKEMEAESNKRRALFLYIECINTLNEGLLLQHEAYGCPKPSWSKYLSFLRRKTFAKLTQTRQLTRQTMEVNVQNQDPNSYPKIQTIFSADCSPYFDWQTVGLVHSFYNSGQPGSITRLLTCTEEDLKRYKGHDLAPTHYVPSMSRHPITGDWYPAINKPAAVVHWINHVRVDAEYVVILDADMIMRAPITPWEFNAAPRRPVSTPYDFLTGCDNELAEIHTRYPHACNKVGGVIIMHIRDVKRFALLWLHKTEQVRADIALRSTNITGDVYEAGLMSQMYGYSFAAAELNFQHVVSNEILIHTGDVPVAGVKYRVLHYSLEFRVGNWSFNKANWTDLDVVNNCWAKFPDPPDPSTLNQSNVDSFQRDLLSIECLNSLNEAIRAHHERRKCPDPSSLSPPAQEPPSHHSLTPPNSKTTIENISSRKFGKFDDLRHESEVEEASDRRSLPPPSPETDSETIASEKLKKNDGFKHDPELKEVPDPRSLPPPSPESTGEITASRKFGKFDEVNGFRHDSEMSNESEELSSQGTSKQTFSSSMRVGMISLWTFSIFIFVAVMWMIISSRRGQKKRGKNLKNKSRISYSGF